jgi:hypothetical protein
LELFQRSFDASPSWTAAEALKILQPLLSLSAERWTFDERHVRLWLYNKKQLPQDWRDHPRLVTFLKEYGRFRVITKKETTQLRTSGTAADELKDEMNRLMQLKRWTVTDVQGMVAALSSITSIDARASSPEAMNLYLRFQKRWSRFVADHPVIACRL